MRRQCSRIRDCLFSRHGPRITQQLRSFALVRVRSHLPDPAPPFRHHYRLVALTSRDERCDDVRSRVQVNHKLDVAHTAYDDEIRRTRAGRREK